MKITVEFDSFEELEAFRVSGLSGASRTPVSGSSLTARTQNLLLAAGIKTIEEAKDVGVYGLLKLSNFGRKSATEVMNWVPVAGFDDLGTIPPK